MRRALIFFTRLFRMCLQPRAPNLPGDLSPYKCRELRRALSAKRNVRPSPFSRFSQPAARLLIPSVTSYIYIELLTLSSNSASS